MFDKLLFSDEILIKLELILVEHWHRLEIHPHAMVQQEFQQLAEVQPVAESPVEPSHEGGPQDDSNTQQESVLIL